MISKKLFNMLGRRRSRYWDGAQGNARKFIYDMFVETWKSGGPFVISDKSLLALALIGDDERFAIYEKVKEEMSEKPSSAIEDLNRLVPGLYIGVANDDAYQLICDEIKRLNAEIARLGSKVEQEKHSGASDDFS